MSTYYSSLSFKEKAKHCLIENEQLILSNIFNKTDLNESHQRDIICEERKNLLMSGR